MTCSRSPSWEQVVRYQPRSGDKIFMRCPWGRAPDRGHEFGAVMADKPFDSDDIIANRNERGAKV